eukprot:gene21940-28019_t
MIACTRPAAKPLHPQDKKRRNVSAPVHAPAPVAVTSVSASEPAPTKKGKKKVRSSKNKKKNSTSPVPDEPESESEPEVEVKKVVVETSVASVDFDDNDDIDLPVFSNKPSLQNAAADKTSKKAKETPEQKAARVERQKAKELRRVAIEEKLAAAALAGENFSDINSFNSSPVAQPQFDGWAVVEVKKSKTKKENEEGDAPSTPVPVVVAPVANVPMEPYVPAEETITVPMTVEARKIGLLIGPKGATKLGIQACTGATIEMPKTDKESTATTAIINVSGSKEAVDNALRALNELCTKGYAMMLSPADFQEGYVAIHPRFLPDQHTGVKITTPANTSKADGTAATKIKINLAGPREKVTEARNLIKEITKYYHTSVTHPGVVHTEMDIPAHYYNYIIGSKGSEIKHIQANFKVNVYIPNAESNNTNVLIVGEPANVAGAEKHVLKLIEKVNAIAEQKAAAEVVAEAYREANKAARAAQAAAPAGETAGKPAARANYSVGGGGKPSTAKVDKDDEVHEEWEKDYAPRSNGIDFSVVLPKSAKFAGVAPSAEVSSEAAPAVSGEPVATDAKAWGAAPVAPV